jgi:hypothetical protein
VLSNPSENFPDFSGIYSHFLLGYFYLLEGSKIFFMSSKYFIWIVHVPIYLWEFSYKFWNFLGIFRALKHFLSFFRICFALENNFRKNKTFLSNRAEPEGPTLSARPSQQARARPIRAQCLRPGRAHGPAAAALSSACAPRMPGAACL